MKSDAKKVLYINLSSEVSEIKVHSDLSDSLGGVGLAAFLLYDQIRKDPIVFSIGPLSSIFPCCSQTCAVFVSPLSRDWGESYSGGWLAAAMRFSALDAIVITGRSKRPVYLVIEDGKVDFRNAKELWGKGNFESYKILAENEGLPGKRSILTIGPAGENQISFASVSVDQFSSFRRLGLGALFGKKGVKGIVISAVQSEEVGDLGLYSKVYQEFIDQIMGNGRISDHSSGVGPFGGFGELSRQNEIGGLPTKNLLGTKFNESFSISGENFRRAFPSKNVASFGCPRAFTHLFGVKKNWLPCDYESLASLGPLLAIDSPRGILSLLARALDLGLDPVSLGVSLAYLTELQNLEFSNYEDYFSLIEALLAGKETWSKALRSGIAVASERLGGEDWALHIAGVEMAPYFNGYATVLGQLIGASHTIYDNEGHKIDLKILGEEFDEGYLIEAIVSNERRNIILNSLIVDYSVREIYADPSLIFSALNSVGFSWPQERLEKFSQELYYLKLRIKKALGWDLDKIRLPQRFFSVPSAYGLLKKERLRVMLNLYKERFL